MYRISICCRFENETPCILKVIIITFDAKFSIFFLNIKNLLPCRKVTKKLRFLYGVPNFYNRIFFRLLILVAEQNVLLYIWPVKWLACLYYILDTLPKALY